jgi:chromosome segregation ATPase
MIEEDYLPVQEHEAIVNQKIKEQREMNAQEIDRLWQQFEAEFVQVQEELDQEKEIIRQEFRQKIGKLEEELDQLGQEYDNTKSMYQQVVDEGKQLKQKVEKLQFNLREAQEKMADKHQTKDGEVKDLEESIFRLNKELSSKTSQIHKLEQENEILQKSKKSIEDSQKHSINLLEKKLKETTSSSTSKISHLVSENTSLTQKLLTFESKLSSLTSDLTSKTTELSRVTSLYDQLWIQHDLLSKTSSDRESYLAHLENQLKDISSKHKKNLKMIGSTTTTMFSYLRRDVEQLKKAVETEVTMMGEFMRERVREVVGKLMKISDKEREMVQREFKDKLDDLHARWEEGEAYTTHLLQQIEDINGKWEVKIKDLEQVLDIKEMTISKLNSKLAIIEKEVSKLYTLLNTPIEEDSDIPSRLIALKGVIESLISSHKESLSKAKESFTEELLKQKESHQTKIDSLFEESFQNAQKISLQSTQISTLESHIFSLTTSLKFATSTLSPLLPSAQTIEDLASGIVHAYGQQSAQLSDLQKDLQKTCRQLEEERKTQLDMQKKLQETAEEVRMRDARIEQTEKELMIGQRKKMKEDENAHVLAGLLKKLEVKQMQRCSERKSMASTFSRSKMTPNR